MTKSDMLKELSEVWQLLFQVQEANLKHENKELQASIRQPNREAIVKVVSLIGQIEKM